MDGKYLPIGSVELTQSEQELWNQVDSDLIDSMDFNRRIAASKAMSTLAKTLFERSAIPKCRIEYFTDPKWCTARGKRSHKEIFESNGTRGEDILEHGHFLKFLRYFILGPQLPAETIAGFCKILNDDLGSSGMAQDQIHKFVRKEIRDRGLRYENGADPSEEFFKLCIELEVDRNHSSVWAGSVRQAAMSAMNASRK